MSQMSTSSTLHLLVLSKDDLETSDATLMYVDLEPFPDLAYLEATVPTIWIPIRIEVDEAQYLLWSHFTLIQYSLASRNLDSRI
jgi:hypothetical protein